MSLQQLNQLRQDLANAAYQVFHEEATYRATVPEEDWEHSGGICDDIAEAMAAVISARGLEALTFNTVASGENHTFVVVRDDDGEAILVDVPFCLYETQRGEYLFDLLPAASVNIIPSDIVIERMGLPFSNFLDEDELTAGQPPLPLEYEQFKARLDDPPVRVLPQHGYERYLTPCDPPEDPAWPTPTNELEVEYILSAIPNTQRIIAAIVAAELILPIYDLAYPKDKSFGVLIDVVREWANGKTKMADLRAAIVAIQSPLEHVNYEAELELSDLPKYAQANAASAISALGMEAYYAWRTYAFDIRQATSIVQLSARAYLQSAGVTHQDFYELWWKEVRCRLSFDDALRADLQNTVGALSPPKSFIEVEKRYKGRIEEFAERYEDRTFQAWAQGYAKFLPKKGAKVLDVGAGSGRDSAELAKMGYLVTAVEPLNEMRQKAQELHPSKKITWLKDYLPNLSRIQGPFELIVANAVLMFLQPAQQVEAITRLGSLLAPGAVLIVNVKHGDVSQAFHKVDVDNLIDAAKKAGMKLEKRSTIKNQYLWETMAFSKSVKRRSRTVGAKPIAPKAQTTGLPPLHAFTEWQNHSIGDMIGNWFFQELNLRRGSTDTTEYTYSVFGDRRRGPESSISSLEVEICSEHLRIGALGSRVPGIRCGDTAWTTQPLEDHRLDPQSTLILAPSLGISIAAHSIYLRDDTQAGLNTEAERVRVQWNALLDKFEREFLAPYDWDLYARAESPNISGWEPREGHPEAHILYVIQSPIVDWDPPQDSTDVRRLFSRLSLWHQIICAVVAIELALPKVPFGNYQWKPTDTMVVNRIVDRMDKWLEGKDVIQELIRFRDILQRGLPRGSGYNSPNEEFIWALIWAVDSMEEYPETHEVFGEAAAEAVVNVANALWHAHGTREHEFYEVWWKACGARLNEPDLPSAPETTGQAPIDPAAYQQFKQRLEDPGPHISPDTYVPGDRFPRKLLHHLNDSQMLQSGVIALEMVLPYWEEWFNARPLSVRGDYPEGSPPKIVEAVKKFIHGEFTATDLQQVSEAAHAYVIEFNVPLTGLSNATQDLTAAAAIWLLVAAALRADRPYRPPQAVEYLRWLEFEGSIFAGQFWPNDALYNIEITVGVADAAYASVHGTSIEEFFRMWGTEVINTVIPLSQRYRFWNLPDPHLFPPAVGQPPLEENPHWSRDQKAEDLELLGDLGYPNAQYINSGNFGNVYQVSPDRVVKLTTDERELHCAELIQHLQEQYGRTPYHEHLPIIYKTQWLGPFWEGMVEREDIPYSVPHMGMANEAAEALEAAGIDTEVGDAEILSNWGMSHDYRVVFRDLGCRVMPSTEDAPRTKKTTVGGDFNDIAKLKISYPLEDEAIMQEGTITISFPHGDEEWPWLLLEGQSITRHAKGGRIVLVSPTDPAGGLLWVEEDGKFKIVSYWVEPQLRRRGALRALVEVYSEHVSPHVVIVGPFSEEGYAAAIALADEVEGELTFSMDPSSPGLLSEIKDEGLMWESGYMAGLMKRPEDQGNMVFSLARAPDGRLVAWAYLELAPADESMRYNEEFRNRDPYDVGIWVDEKFRRAGVAKRLLSMLLKIGGEEGLYIGYHEWVCGILDKLGALYICHENDEKHVRDPYGILKH